MINHIPPAKKQSSSQGRWGGVSSFTNTAASSCVLTSIARICAGFFCGVVMLSIFIVFKNGACSPGGEA